MFSGSNTNKRRLYLALYPRRPADENPEPFHVALLSMRKRPSNTDRDTFRYYVMDVPNPQGLVQWEFRGDGQQRARSLKLVALVLLGKLSPSVTDEDLKKHLQNVKIVQGNPTWFCTHWCMNAIQVLADAGIINPEASSAEIVATGKAFAAQHRLNLEVPIPTCRVDGVKIASEVTYSYV